MTSSTNDNLTKSPQKSNIWSNSQDKLKIIIRIRPVLNQQQQTQFVELEDHNMLQIKRPGNFTFMKFNNILPYYSTQKDVFNLLQDSVNQFLNGTNITIFAYGQTGAGKTYSIIGNFSTSPKISESKVQNNDNQNIFHLLSSQQRGILSRSLQMIMQALQNQEQSKVTISFYEIYNQKIYDLYNKEGSGALDIRQTKNGEISIPNLITIQITRIQQAIHYLMIGLKNRSTGSTHANAKSSRSHSIFQINLQKQGRFSSLRIVDLAGSQKFKIPSDITPAQKQIRIQQLTNINGSLSCLGHCISALIQKSRTHVPFRNSKLTRILSDSLLGQGKMRFIICISPSVSASAQTFSTLQFANRAKRAIFDRSQMRTPQMNKKKSENQEMVILKKQLEKQRQFRVECQQQLSKVKKESMLLKIENQKLYRKIKSIQASIKPGYIERSNIDDKKSQHTNICIRQEQNQNFQSQNKDNSSFHQQMLNLPIFQKNRVLTANSSNVSSSASRNKLINVKKAQFQKKIRKFIEQSSPQQKQQSQKQVQFVGSAILHQVNYNRPVKNSSSSKRIYDNSQKKKESMPTSQNKECQKEYKVSNHFNNDKKNTNNISNILSFDKAQRKSINLNEQNQEQFDSLWQYKEQETDKFLERACQKMNMKEYENLKEQMQKAKNQLLKFKHLDDQLQKKKTICMR